MPYPWVVFCECSVPKQWDPTLVGKRYRPRRKKSPFGKVPIIRCVPTKNGLQSYRIDECGRKLRYGSPSRSRSRSASPRRWRSLSCSPRKLCGPYGRGRRSASPRKAVSLDDCREEKGCYRMKVPNVFETHILDHMRCNCSACMDFACNWREALKDELSEKIRDPLSCNYRSQRWMPGAPRRQSRSPRRRRNDLRSQLTCMSGKRKTRRDSRGRRSPKVSWWFGNYNPEPDPNSSSSSKLEELRLNQPQCKKFYRDPQEDEETASFRRRRRKFVDGYRDVAMDGTMRASRLPTFHHPFPCSDPVCQDCIQRCTPESQTSYVRKRSKSRQTLAQGVRNDEDIPYDRGSTGKNSFYDKGRSAGGDMPCDFSPNKIQDAPGDPMIFEPSRKGQKTFVERQPYGQADVITFDPSLRRHRTFSDEKYYDGTDRTFSDPRLKGKKTFDDTRYRASAENMAFDPSMRAKRIFDDTKHYASADMAFDPRLMRNKTFNDTKHYPSADMAYDPRLRGRKSFNDTKYYSNAGVPFVTSPKKTFNDTKYYSNAGMPFETSKKKTYNDTKYYSSSSAGMPFDPSPRRSQTFKDKKLSREISNLSCNRTSAVKPYNPLWNQKPYRDHEFSISQTESPVDQGQDFAFRSYSSLLAPERRRTPEGEIHGLLGYRPTTPSPIKSSDETKEVESQSDGKDGTCPVGNKVSVNEIPTNIEDGTEYHSPTAPKKKHGMPKDAQNCVTKWKTADNFEKEYSASPTSTDRHHPKDLKSRKQHHNWHHQHHHHHHGHHHHRSQHPHHHGRCKHQNHDSRSSKAIYDMHSPDNRLTDEYQDTVSPHSHQSRKHNKTNKCSRDCSHSRHHRDTSRTRWTCKHHEAIRKKEYSASKSREGDCLSRGEPNSHVNPCTGNDKTEKTNRPSVTDNSDNAHRVREAHASENVEDLRRHHHKSACRKCGAYMNRNCRHTSKFRHGRTSEKNRNKQCRSCSPQKGILVSPTKAATDLQDKSCCNNSQCTSWLSNEGDVSNNRIIIPPDVRSSSNTFMQSDTSDFPHCRCEHKTTNPHGRCEHKTKNPRYRCEHKTENLHCRYEHKTTNPHCRCEHKTGNPHCRCEHKTTNQGRCPMEDNTKSSHEPYDLPASRPYQYDLDFHICPDKSSSSPTWASSKHLTRTPSPKLRCMPGGQYFEAKIENIPRHPVLPSPKANPLNNFENSQSDSTFYTRQPPSDETSRYSFERSSTSPEKNFSGLQKSSENNSPHHEIEIYRPGIRNCQRRPPVCQTSQNSPPKPDRFSRSPDKSRSRHPSLSSKNYLENLQTEISSLSKKPPIYPNSQHSSPKSGRISPNKNQSRHHSLSSKDSSQNQPEHLPDVRPPSRKSPVCPPGPYSPLKYDENSSSSPDAQGKKSCRPFCASERILENVLPENQREWLARHMSLMNECSNETQENANQRSWRITEKANALKKSMEEMHFDFGDIEERLKRVKKLQRRYLKNADRVIRMARERSDFFSGMQTERNENNPCWSGNLEYSNTMPSLSETTDSNQKDVSNIPVCVSRSRNRDEDQTATKSDARKSPRDVSSSSSDTNVRREDKNSVNSINRRRRSRRRKSSTFQQKLSNQGEPHALSSSSTGCTSLSTFNRNSLQLSSMNSSTAQKRVSDVEGRNRNNCHKDSLNTSTDSSRSSTNSQQTSTTKITVDSKPVPEEKVKALPQRGTDMKRRKNGDDGRSRRSLSDKCCSDCGSCKDKDNDSRCKTTRCPEKRV